jgi:hypothetical protein
MVRRNVKLILYTRLPTSVINIAYEKALHDQQSDDSDDIESTYSKRKRQQRFDRERNLLSSLQGLETDLLPDYPPALARPGINTARGLSSPNPAYSTPQQTRQRGREREGPHSWPKKSRIS